MSNPAITTPVGPCSGFGKEITLADYLARIEWEAWAACTQRETGHEALAVGHDLARVAYLEALSEKFGNGHS